jgi:Na+-driven multidrug efflux pump
MIAFINTIVAGAGITLLAMALFGEDQLWLALSGGIASAVLLSVAFLAYQRWRFRVFDNASPMNAEKP